MLARPRLPNAQYAVRTYANALSLPPRRTINTSIKDKEPKVIFSGIQPTGVPHLGNYLGALQQWVKLQNDASDDTTLIYSIVDLHAKTVYQKPEDLKRCKKESLATLLAVGLDPKRSTIFYQSSVHEHSELMWILSCEASMGYLSRMTQWKSKMDLPENADPQDPSSKSKLKLGLFSYPVLQAADVLVHRATHVPVGADQSQHLEFARQCAKSFNHTYGRVFVPPETILSPAKRVMALDKPNLKMSKSNINAMSRILLTDSREEIDKKLRIALTDSIEGVSYNPTKRPGVANLIDIMFHLEPVGASSAEEMAHDFGSHSLKALKEEVAEVVDVHLAPIRDRFESIMSGNGQELEHAAALGKEKASQSASTTMKLVREATGL